MSKRKTSRSVLVLVLGIVSATTQISVNAAPFWTLRAVELPPRQSHAVVYDSCRDVTVLYGGHNSEESPRTFYHETWEWDGTSWSLRATSGPTVTNAHTMAFDSNRCKTVLFGGNDPSGSYYNETWEWDGTTWEQMLPSISPGVRHVVAMAFDSARGVVLMFGGWRCCSFLNDTWTWDGSTWTQLFPSTAPSPRSGAALIYDPVSDRFIMFGGRLVPAPCGTKTDETWAFDPSVPTWSLLNPISSPKGRETPAMVYDSERNVAVMFGGGGCLPEMFSDTWEWNGTNWSFITAVIPTKRFAHGAAYDKVRQEVVMFGGSRVLSVNPDTSISLGDTWVYSVNRQPTCNEGGPYTAECEGMTTGVVLDGSGSIDPDGDPLSFGWSTDCPGGIFDDSTSATPVLTVDSSGGCTTKCSVTLMVDDGNGGTTECATTVTIEDTTPPVVRCAAVSFEDHIMGIEYTVEDECGEVTGSAVIETRCCPLPVVDGQIVKVICKDHEECRLDVDFDRGRFRIRTDEATLIVTATDACGNEATCTAEICIPGADGENDDD